MRIGRLALAVCLVLGAALTVDAAPKPRGPSPPFPANTRKAMGWVSAQFPLATTKKCDPVSYHSSLRLNLTRPDLQTFCFDVQQAAAKNAYKCDKAGLLGSIDLAQVRRHNITA